MKVWSGLDVGTEAETETEAEAETEAGSRAEPSRVGLGWVELGPAAR